MSVYFEYTILNWELFVSQKIEATNSLVFCLPFLPLRRQAIRLIIPSFQLACLFSLLMFHFLFGFPCDMFWNGISFYLLDVELIRFTQFKGGKFSIVKSALSLPFKYLSFRIWLISLSMIISRSIDTAANVIVSFFIFPMAE